VARGWRQSLRRVVRRVLPHTLTARLLTTTIALVTLVSIVVVMVTTIALRHFLLDRLDQQLAEVADRQPPGFGQSSGFATCLSRGTGFGQAPDTVVARFDSECHTAVLITENGVLQPLDAHDTSTLAGVDTSDSALTISLSMGSYRVMADPTPDGAQVTGLPTKDVNDTVGRVLLWEVSVAVAVVVLAAMVGQGVVRRQLAPLRRVAATATEVTSLPLDSGEVGVTARVPAELTDERTEVGQVGAALNAMLGHVENALAARHESEQRVRQFLADASHELRTPLSTILGYAELSRRTATMDTPATHAMSRIQAESGRMSSLVNDLLLLARLDSGRPLDRADVDMSLLLAEALNDARVVSVEHEWRLRLPDSPAFVVGDTDRLHQVVANLLANARRHTPPGTVVDLSATVTLRDGTRPHGVEVTVHDNGPGFPPELTGKEFERFSRGDASRTRSSGGTGLGLSIVQAIVAAHGGRVQVSSVPGSTTVRVWLPSTGSQPTHSDSTQQH
jgi:two-component system OmpR family sensor kinase